MKYYFILLLFAAQLASAQSVKSILTGRASYYHNRFHGKSTASGEKYSQQAYTCAHRTLPFNTWVRVTNTKTGRSVNLRVTDRGPYVKNRLIDVSHAAARYLGMEQKGTTLVEMEVLEPIHDLSQLTDKVLAVQQRMKPDTLLIRQLYNLDGQRQPVQGYAFQVNTFRKFENALNEARYLCSKGIEYVNVMPDLVRGETLYKVMAGRYDSQNSAQSDADRFQQLGYDAFIVDVKRPMGPMAPTN